MRFTQGHARQRIALIACGAVLCLLVGRFGLSVTGIFKLPFLENAVSAVVTPVAGWVTDTYTSIRSGAEKKSTIAELNEEIAMLTERNRQLEATVMQMSELQKENDRLKSLLNVTEMTPDVEYIAASVSAMEPGGWFVTFTVDKGPLHGVKKNDEGEDQDKGQREAQQFFHLLPSLPIFSLSYHSRGADAIASGRLV